MFILDLLLNVIRLMNAFQQLKLISMMLNSYDVQARRQAVVN